MMARGFPLGTDRDTAVSPPHTHAAADTVSGEFVSARMPTQAAVADLVVMDTTLVPSLLNLVGGTGLTADVRTKVNEVIVALNAVLARLRSAELVAP